MSFGGSARVALTVAASMSISMSVAPPAAAQTQAASGVNTVGPSASGMGIGGTYVDPATAQKRREIERAYRAATQKIPTQEGNNDPWAGMRSADEGTKKR